MLFGFAMLMLGVYFYADVNLETALLIPSGAAILVYVIGSASGIKLLRGREDRTVFAWISLLMSLAILPFVGVLALIAVFAGLAGLGFVWFSGRRGAGAI
jgi:amino acid efflux transporter